jgi:transposase
VGARGETPILIHTGGNWKRLSVAGALAYRWEGGRSRFFFYPRWRVHRSRPRSLRARAQTAFSRTPHPLIWDGLGGHKSRYMTAYLKRQRPWLTVERLPAYVPELNPLGRVWGNVKTRDLANACAPDLASLRQPLRCGFARIRQQPTLARAFLRHAGLSF